ncbi:YoaK family protein [Cupriavidus sp. IDO]|uniref:YoaK family protein n=1 Tax=Cupriavidus sp. IDO TaxID=1539142 RepID=UPI000578E88E|nr:YoaK family protein [Cupriavidus sp. IDO]KWR91572.1 hypothetical protein RM96_03565 [Cupriavidus sp. IDO]
MNNIEAAKTHPIVAILLTLNGGFLDAFTYLGHGNVFANSMTGNIVMLAVNLAGGDMHQTLRHIWPLIGFVCGIFAARLLQLIAWRHPSSPAIISLVFEIAFLALAALKELPEFWLLAGVAFVATQQSTFFTHSGNQTYSSVMTTGNLRRCLQLLFESTIPRVKAAGLRDAAGLGAISLSFVLGALAGGLITHRLHDAALWLPAALLLAALVEIYRHARAAYATP